LSMSSGYIQIHQKGYWENKSVDSSFEENPALTTIFNSEKEIVSWTPRLETFALASNGENTKGIIVMGIDPVKENAESKLSQRVVSGKYLEDSDRSVLLAEGLAEYLKLKVKDTVILLGQGYHGNMAAAKYPVEGIVKLGIPVMNKGMIWLPMAGCRDFLSTGARFTSISLMLNKRDKLDALKHRLIKQTKGLGYEVMAWQDMNPELDQLFEAKMAQNEIMSGVLYLVIAFGIFGTILMMLNERLHEFGILIAIGMKKRILSGIVVLEMLLMSIIGTLSGIAGSFLIVLYWWYHPIHMSGALSKEMEKYNFEPVIQPSLDISNFIIQGYAVISIAFLLSLYAIFKIHKMKAIEAINS